MPPSPEQLGRIREYTDGWKAGDQNSFAAFADLVAFLLHVPVAEVTDSVRIVRGAARERALLAPLSGPTRPLRLRDGRFLKITVNLALVDTDDGVRMKSPDCSFRYQDDERGKDWVFRSTTNAILLITIRLRISTCEAISAPKGYSTADQPLERVHFPVARPTLEGVIRLLAEQFGVPTNEEPHVCGGRCCTSPSVCSTRSRIFRPRVRRNRSRLGAHDRDRDASKTPKPVPRRVPLNSDQHPGQQYASRFASRRLAHGRRVFGALRRVFSRLRELLDPEDELDQGGGEDRDQEQDEHEARAGPHERASRRERPIGTPATGESGLDVSVARVIVLPARIPAPPRPSAGRGRARTSRRSRRAAPAPTAWRRRTPAPSAPAEPPARRHARRRPTRRTDLERVAGLRAGELELLRRDVELAVAEPVDPEHLTRDAALVVFAWQRDDRRCERGGLHLRAERAHGNPGAQVGRGGGHHVPAGEGRPGRGQLILGVGELDDRAADRRAWPPRGPGDRCRGRSGSRSRPRPRGSGDRSPRPDRRPRAPHPPAGTARLARARSAPARTSKAGTSWVMSTTRARGSMSRITA